MVLQPDGKLVAAGHWNATGNGDFALARYHPNGTLDTSFGSSGLVLTDFGGSSDFVLDLVLQPDGKLVAAGGPLGGNDFALARYNGDGSLDASFGDGGRVLTDFVGLDAASALVLQPDGKLVAVGYSNAAGNADFALARYNPNGTLDTSFGSGGRVLSDFGSGDAATDLVLQPDGKLVAAGHSNATGTFHFALARYNPNGTLDTSFGSGGRVLSDFGGSQEFAFALVLQPDGRLVVAGDSNAAGNVDFALGRYHPNGTLDTSFGSGGRVLSDFAGSRDRASALVLQPDGKLVAVGASNAGGDIDFALARYLGTLDSSPPPPPPRVTIVYLLLHGTASDPTTWDDLVRDRFGDHCPVTELGQNLTEDSVCYRIEFADIPIGDIWTNGDGSKFDTLGTEVRIAIDKIEARMHPAAIILVGHSRGGLAARAYLQKITQQPPYKLGLLTIGTPHQGTPLGRIKHCLTNKDCLDKKYTPANIPIGFRGLLKAVLFSPSAGYQASAHDSAGNPVRTSISKQIHALNAKVHRLDDWVLTFGQLYSHDLRLAQNIHSFIDLLDNGRRLGSLGRWFVPGDFIKLRKYVLENIVSGIKTTGASFCVKADRTFNNWACNGDGVAPTISQRLSRLPGFSRGSKPLHSRSVKGVSHISETGRTLEINIILDAMENDLR